MGAILRPMVFYSENRSPAGDGPGMDLLDLQYVLWWLGVLMFAWYAFHATYGPQSIVVDMNSAQLKDITQARLAYLKRHERPSARPTGRPLFKEAPLRTLKVFENGLFADFAVITMRKEDASTTGLGVNAVAMETRSFVPWDLVSEMYLLHLREGPHPLDESTPVTKALQVETKDFRTAILRTKGDIAQLLSTIQSAAGPSFSQFWRPRPVLSGEITHKGKNPQGDLRGRWAYGAAHKHAIIRLPPPPGCRG